MKAKPELSLHQVTVQDLDTIRALYLDVWGYNRPRTFDQWRFFDAPYGICPAVLAMDGERPVGFYTVWPVKIRLTGRMVLGGQSMDTMTHPDYQGQGIFPKLANACYELSAARGYKILYGFPNPLSYPGFIQRLEWQHTGDITHWIRPIRPSGHPGIPSLLGPVTDLIVRCYPKGSTRQFDISIGIPSLDMLGGQMREWNKQIGGHQIDRTPNWLKWRYADQSENDYEWVCAYRQGKLSAIGVWGMQNVQWGQVADQRAHLVELSGIDHTARQAILATVIKRAFQKSAILIETMTNIGEVTATLRRAGFIRHRQAPLIIRSLDNDVADAAVYDHDLWRFIGGDVDTF